METTFQLLVNGLAMGSIYSLIALGFVLVYVAVNVVNFAQGDFIMVGAFICLSLYSNGIPIWFALIASVLIMGIFGFLYQIGVYRPFRSRSKSFLPVMISTLGASMFFQSLFLVIYGPDPRSLPPLIGGDPIQLGGLPLPRQSLVIIVFALLLFGFQFFLFEKTNLGKKMQATAQDPETARLMGINVAWMNGLTFVYCTALGGIAGILLAPLFTLTTTIGSIFGLKAFAAAIVGGFSDAKGAIVGGLFIGVIESFSAYFGMGAYMDASAFIVLVLFLIFRPSGLFGEKIGTKA
ncbi:branched-chain amino acid ABC transporter permease [Ferviditalea candida]|uniref:Branched-chain amino acid ABC transporter permease n=1 Tax=Ferviditalea candida TaxID=3108399 RepID=A0ABU5ZLW6_9BACL|nr:branched-chain amino acid ABC transporter permease [Paenibacillaceae bacterium T2]